MATEEDNGPPRLTPAAARALFDVNAAGGRLPFSAIRGQTRVHLFNLGLLHYTGDGPQGPECALTPAGTERAQHEGRM